MAADQSTVIKPPAGFELDSTETTSQQTEVAPPPGFEIDQPAQPESKGWEAAPMPTNPQDLADMAVGVDDINSQPAPVKQAPPPPPDAAGAAAGMGARNALEQSLDPMSLEHAQLFGPQAVGLPEPEPSLRTRISNAVRGALGIEKLDESTGMSKADIEQRRAQAVVQQVYKEDGQVPPAMIPDQFTAGFSHGFSAGLVPDTHREPLRTSEDIARGLGELSGFILGAPAWVAKSITLPGEAALAAKEGGKFLPEFTKEVTRQSVHLAKMFAVGSTGEALDQKNLADALSVIKDATINGAETGAIFGLTGELVPGKTPAARAARFGIVSAALDLMNGSRPWDDREFAQKVFDYGLNAYFTWGSGKGMPAPDRRLEPRPGEEDRRHEFETRKRVAELTPEEMRQELLTNPVSGIPNRRAYEEAEKQPVQVSIDADSLKWVNDNMGPESGDRLLKTVGRVLRDVTPEAYHISGDEFMSQARTDKDAAKIIDEVNKRLRKAEITAELPDGRRLTKTGLEITYGTGTDKKAADFALKAAKIEREKAGLRAARGEQPPGVAEITPERQQDRGRETPKREQLGPKSEQRSRKIREEMSVDEIRAEIDQMSEAAKARMQEAQAGKPAREAPESEIDFMTPEQRQRFNDLKNALPSSGEERQAATARIKKRIAQRKEDKERGPRKKSTRGTLEKPDEELRQVRETAQPEGTETLSSILQKVSRGEYEAKSPEVQRIVARAEKEGELEKLRKYISETGKTVAEGVREVWESELSKAPRELRQAIEREVALPEVSHKSTPKKKPRTLGQKTPESVASRPGEKYAGFINSAAIPEPAELPAEPISRDGIIKRLAERMNIPIYTGRVRGAKRLGFYRLQNDEVRIKRRNDLEVTAHEIAHFVDYNNPEISKAYKRKEFKKELKAISYDASKLHEGFAEFVRLWATQPVEAAQRAPQFYDWFEDWVNNNKKFGEPLREAQTSMQEWYAQGRLNRLKSKIGKPIIGITERLSEVMDRFVDKRIAESLDGLQGLKAAELDLVGQIESANDSPYKSMRLVAGSRGIIKMALLEGTPSLDAKGNITFSGEGLKSVLEPVHNKLEDWGAYMVAKRAQELKQQGREKLLTDDEIQAGLELAKDKDIVEARRRYRDFNSRMMDFYEQLGLVNKESRKAMEEANQEYIPFNRVIEEFDGTNTHKAGNPMKRLRGSDRNIDDIVDNITSNIAVMTHRGLTNRAKLQAYDMVTGHKMGARYAVKIPPDSKKVQIPVEEVRRAFLESLGLKESMLKFVPIEFQMHFDRMFMGMKDVAQFWVHGQAPLGKNIDSVMRKGKLEYYEIADPLFFKAMNHYGSKSMNLAMSILGGAKNVLTRGVTSMPDFMIPNLLRDATMGYLLSKGGMKPFVGSIKGLYDRLSNDPAFKEFIANGGGYASTIQGETKAMRRDLEKLYESAGIDMKAVIDSPKKLLNAWDEFNGAFEYGTRLNEFKRLRAKGVSPREAAFQARDITTDFAMRGYSDVLRVFTTSVPFFNAGLQGLYRLGRAFSSVDVVKNADGQVVGRTDPVQLTAKAIAAITIPTLLLWYLNHKDERYQKLDDWVKDLNWVFLLPKGTQEKHGVPEIYLLPKPFEVGALFASIPERSAQAFYDRDGEKYIQSMEWIIANQLRLQPWRIQLFQPIIETQVANKNFTGAPIIPDDLKNVEPFEQYRAYTPETARFLGKVTNTSPLKIEHWVRGYFGYLGMYGLQATDALLGGGTVKRPSSRLDQYPVFRRLTRQLPLRNTSFETDFYGMAQQSEKVVNTFNKMMKEYRPDEAAEYLGDKGNATAYGLSKTLQKIRRTASTLRAKMNTIRNAPNMDAETKRKNIDNLQAQYNKLMEQASKALNTDEFKEFREQVELRK